MSLAPILAAVQDRAGLDPITLGTHAVRAAVGERLRALGLSEPEYATRLAGDAAEFSRLVADVVVPETWFFRGGELFDHAADLARAGTVRRGSACRAAPARSRTRWRSRWPSAAWPHLAARSTPSMSARGRSRRHGPASTPSIVPPDRQRAAAALATLPRGGEIDPAIRAGCGFRSATCSTAPCSSGRSPTTWCSAATCSSTSPRRPGGAAWTRWPGWSRPAGCWRWATPSAGPGETRFEHRAARLLPLPPGLGGAG
ncbi:MAG: hypothetical protein U0797_27080 [Gemmataceae bacterium]